VSRAPRDQHTAAPGFPVRLRLTREDARELAPVVVDLLTAELPVSTRAAVLALAVQLHRQVAR
jgi:hypothetical protein